VVHVPGSPPTLLSSRCDAGDLDRRRGQQIGEGLQVIDVTADVGVEVDAHSAAERSGSCLAINVAVVLPAATSARGRGS
jgi:hypothetical protein